MSPRIARAVALTAALAAGLSAAHAAPGTLSASQVHPSVAVGPAVFAALNPLTCVVRGTPVEFPSDLYVYNTGAAAIPAGSVIRWEVTPAIKGLYVLPAALAGHSGTFFIDVIPGGWPAGAPCKATKL